MGTERITRTWTALFPRQSVDSSVQDEANSPSLSQLVATLAPALIFAALYLCFFLLLRTRIARAYSPRTFLGTLRQQERTPELPKGLVKWFASFVKLPDTYVLNHQSLDGFLLLRYLRISSVICLVGCLITWPVLFPVNATGGGGQEQLNIISFSNIAGSEGRYYAHTVVAWLFFGFVFYMVMRESVYYIHLRQAYLLSPMYANRISSRTVLFTNVPNEYRDAAKLHDMLGTNVKNVWVASDSSEVEKLVERRDKIALKLEAAETKLVKMANKARLRASKKGDEHNAAEMQRNTEAEESGLAAARWVPSGKRPSHRLRLLIGKKVDTIDWCRAQLQELIPKVTAAQKRARDGEDRLIGAAFVEYDTQLDAQEAFQGLTHHQAFHITPRFIGLNPEEVIWRNLKINWASRLLRITSTTAIITVVVIFWAIPVAFVGVLSNIKALSQGDPTANPPKAPLLPWLSWINKIPSEILGVIQGLLPSVLLAVLMALLPPFLYLMAKIAGKPSRATVELHVQNSYFVFQVIQVFLVTTVSSGASASAIQVINKPTEATSLLAENLPKASNFYISYFILQGLAIASGSLAQVVEILLFLALGKLLDSTPRKKFKRFVELSGIGWGTEFPVYTLLTVIALTYSVIAPLVLGFATIGMYLIYLVYRYNLLFVFNSDVDTKGLVYARALQQTTTGCYLGIVCLIGLFAIKHVAGPLILMIILLVICIFFHMAMNSGIEPLLNYLPRSLLVEEESLLAMESNEEADKENDKSLAVVSRKSTSQSTKLRPELKKSNFITKFLLPHKYDDYYTLRKLVNRDFANVSYTPEVEEDAYYHPAITSSTPVLWIPRDPMGVSSEECRHTRTAGIEISDEMAGFNKKGRIIWDHENARPPIYEEKICY